MLALSKSELASGNSLVQEHSQLYWHGLLCPATPALGCKTSSRARLTPSSPASFFLLSCTNHLKNDWDAHLFLEPEDMKLITQCVWSQAVVQDLDKCESSWKSRMFFCNRKVQILGQRSCLEGVPAPFVQFSVGRGTSLDHSSDILCRVKHQGCSSTCSRRKDSPVWGGKTVIIQNNSCCWINRRHSVAPDYQQTHNIPGNDPE